MHGVYNCGLVAVTLRQQCWVEFKLASLSKGWPWPGQMSSGAGPQRARLICQDSSPLGEKSMAAVGAAADAQCSADGSARAGDPRSANLPVSCWCCTGVRKPCGYSRGGDGGGCRVGEGSYMAACFLRNIHSGQSGGASLTAEARRGLQAMQRQQSSRHQRGT